MTQIQILLNYGLPLQNWNVTFMVALHDDISLAIIENSKTKLVLKATESSEYYSLMIITYVGDKLNIKGEYYVNGVLDDTDNLVFNKTNANLNNLAICDMGSFNGMKSLLHK